MADKSQQTEQATPRRIHKARQEGRFPSARQFVSGVQFCVFVAVMSAWGAGWVLSTQSDTAQMLQKAFRTDLEGAGLVRLLVVGVWRTSLPLLVGGALLLVATLAAQMAVTNLGVTVKRVTPDVKRLSPMAKLRELPRQNIPSAVQAIFLLPLFSAAVYYIAKAHVHEYLTLPLRGAGAGAQQMATSLLELLWKASAAFLVFGFIDLFRQRRRYMQDLKMTKQEVRDELKEVEGNPQIKARVRRIRRDLLRRRMMQEVPKATAVVVNPTHFAVALRYDANASAAPVVVAKGKNFLALRIRQKAVEHQVPLIENPPLAQALYHSVEVGQEIPAHLYRAVAEVLAYIFRLMNRNTAMTGGRN
ncbi:MAG: EscU/YscU/HrcU family type III secretion system export apparatus switch protein [Chloroflexi bacterium]|nr:MAG: EscU/YscU/HrcU family type III secretion system export apparatus switch protein [Chloroflexota bacterium]